MLILAGLGLGFGLGDGLEASAQVTFAGTQMSVGGTRLASPTAVAVDAKGNLFIADTANNRVLEVVPSSTGNANPAILTTGLAAPAGIAADWAGNLYIADTGNNRVVMLPVTAAGFGAPVAIATGLSGPTGIAVDSGYSLYIADTGNNRVLQLPQIGTGFGSASVVATGFSSPQGLAVDAARNLYVADTGNNRIEKIPMVLGVYGPPQLLFKNLASPLGVAVDKDYNVYIADTGNHRILEEPWAAGAKRFGTSTVLGSDFIAPAGVSVDAAGDVFMADSATSQVMEIVAYSVSFSAINVNMPGEILAYDFILAPGTTLGQVSIEMLGVSGMDFTDAGGSTCAPQTYAVATVCAVNVNFTPLASGLRQGAVVLYDGQGNALATAFLSGTGMEPQIAFVPAATTVLGTQLSGPGGVAVDGNGNVYIADTGNNRVVEVPATANGYGAQNEIPITGLNTPMGLAIDGAGNFYIVSNGNDKVIKLPSEGNAFGAQSRVGFGLYGPSNIAVDRAGNIYITDTLDNQLSKLAWTGSAYLQAQSLGNYRKTPVGVAVDANGNVYFAMPYQDAVIEVPLAGTQYQPQVTLSLKGMSFPTALAVDGNNNLYVLDSGNNRVVMLPWTTAGFGQQITVASGFNAPGGMALDSNGNLYIADTGNNQVVKVNLSTPGSLGFANTFLGSTSSDSAQVALVQNTGNLPLSITSITYPSDFPESAAATSACTGVSQVSPGTSCELAINFTPASIGSPLTESVTLTDDALSVAGSQQTLPVWGTSIGLQNQSINFSAIANTTYGAGSIVLAASASSGLPITYQVISGPATLTRQGSALSIGGVGLVIVQATQNGNGAYGAATPVTQSFTIVPAALTLTAVNATGLYGAVPTTFSYTLSGFVLGQSANQVVAGKPFITSNAGPSAPAGNYVLTPLQGTLAATNYAFVFVTGTLTVNKAPILVSATSASIPYGAATRAIGWSLSGFVNGDTASTVLGSPTLTGTGGTNPGVGKYTISPSLGTLSSANYTFNFASGTLTIVPAVLTVTAGSINMTYGGAIPQTTYTITGFVAGDSAVNSIQGSPQLSPELTQKSSAGTYTVNASRGTLTASNYSFLFVSGSIQVNKAVLTIMVEDRTMTYGSNLPKLNYTANGLVNGDIQATAIAGVPALTTDATSASRPGVFAIHATQGSLTAKNYSFAFQSGTLTVGKAVLQVKPAVTSMTYGSRLPSIAYTITGYLNGDTARVVTGKPAFSTQASSASPVGTYSVSGTFGTLASGSYTFKVQSGTCSVTKALLTVRGGFQSMTYGATRPAFTYSFTGFMNGDAPAVVSGAPFVQSTASSTSAAGAYPVSLNAGTLSATNYTFAFSAGTMTVEKAVLMVTATNQFMIYGAPLPAFSYTISGFVNGDSQSKAITGTPALTTKASASTAVGKYGITPAEGTLASANYIFQLVSGSLSIGKALLTVSAGSQSMTYGGAFPAASYTITGFVNGDTQPQAVSGKPEIICSASKKSSTGTYTISASQGLLTSANYTFTFVSGSMTVNPALLTVTASNQSMTAGATLPALTYTLTGLVNGDTQTSAATGAPALTTTATSASAAGNYPIAAGAGKMTSTNYELTFTNGTLTVTQ